MTKSLVHFAAPSSPACPPRRRISRLETSWDSTYVRTASTDAAPAFAANGGSGQFAYSFNRHFSAAADVGCRPHRRHQ